MRIADDGSMMSPAALHIRRFVVADPTQHILKQLFFAWREYLVKKHRGCVKRSTRCVVSQLWRTCRQFGPSDKRGTHIRQRFDVHAVS